MLGVDDGGFINADDTDKPAQRTWAERLAELDARVAAEPSKPASVHMRELFPEIDALMTYGIAMAERNVPKVAPGLWRTHRFPGEHACDFTLRIYKEWLPHMHRADIEHLDPVLARKLTNDKAYHGDLGGLQLPTLQEHHVAWAKRNGIGPETQHSSRHRLLRRMDSVAERVSRGGLQKPEILR